MGDVWADIPGYEGSYQVSRNGRVRSLDRVVKYRNGAVHNYRGAVLKEKVMPNGYAVVRLTLNDVVENALVHRLVAQSFVPNPDGKPHVNHKDQNRLNNDASNLEWCTARENINYPPTKTRMIASKIEQRGRAVVQIEPSTNEIVGRFGSMGDAARFVGTSVQNIFLICRGIHGHHTAAGYKWRYEDEVTA